MPISIHGVHGLTDTEKSAEGKREVVDDTAVPKLLYPPPFLISAREGPLACYVHHGSFSLSPLPHRHPPLTFVCVCVYACVHLLLRPFPSIFQDAISRESVGAKAAGLLDDCVALSLQARQDKGAVAAAAAAVASPRDRYFQHTQGVLDALVELHTPR